MTRRTEWPAPAAPVDGSGDPVSSRAEAGSLHDPEEIDRRGERRGRRRRSAPEAAAEPTATDPLERARAICLRQLTGTPRTRRQLAEVLRKREIPDDAAEEVLSRFEDVGLIDDAAFADAWVESRHRSRGLARGALARELRTKGVDSEVIAEAVEQLDPAQEEATARQLVERKLAATRGVEPTKRMRRLVGMLARKGYAQGLAVRVVRQALEEEGTREELLEQYLPED